MESIRKPSNPMLDHNARPFYPMTDASQVVIGDKRLDVYLAELTAAISAMQTSVANMEADE